MQTAWVDSAVTVYKGSSGMNTQFEEVEEEDRSRGG